MMSQRWVAASAAAATPSISLSIAPQQDDQLPFLHDKHYALDGEIMMFVLVVFFSIFILFLVMLPCLRRIRNHDSGCSDTSVAAQQSSLLPWLIRKRRIDEEVSLQCQISEVSRKFPLWYYLYLILNWCLNWFTCTKFFKVFVFRISRRIDAWYLVWDNNIIYWVKPLCKFFVLYISNLWLWVS